MDHHSATPTTSTITTQGPGPPPAPAPAPTPVGGMLPAQVLEISLISAQDLTPLYKSMRTYAVAWLNPNQKVTTRTDQHHTNPTWNDKFTFNVDIQALFAENAVLQVEIYTVSWFRHVLVGTVKVLVSDLLAPAIRGSPQHSTRFVALQIRRPSGTPQGILNMGITFHDHSLRAMLREHHRDNFSEIYGKAPGPTGGPTRAPSGNQDDETDAEFRKKIQMWRRSSSESEINHDDFPIKAGSVCNGSMINGSVANGSMINGSELCSDIGPSASIVAADLAMRLQPPPPVAKRQIVKPVAFDDSQSSVVEELTMAEAIAKGYIVRAAGEKWRRVVYDGDSELSGMSYRHSRRNSDGGLFSCFVAGIEFRIACGAGNNPGGNRHGNAGAGRRRELH